MNIGSDEQATHDAWMRDVLRGAECQGGVIRLTGHGSVTDPHTIETGACTQCEYTEPASRGTAIETDDLGGYLVPVDPMDALGCDSCQ
ncbi:hypothetical protein [Humibacter ginsengisoli]